MEHSKSSDKSEYRVGLHSVRLQTAPTGRESVHLFFEFTINDLAHIRKECKARTPPYPP